MDCGLACLRTVADYYGKKISIESLRKITHPGKQGVSLLGMAQAAEHIGFKTQGVQLTLGQLMKEAKLPAILHWQQSHFIVIIPNPTASKIRIADPAVGIMTYTKEEFCRHWISSKTENGQGIGIALLIEPTPAFYEDEYSDKKVEGIGWTYLYGYVRPYRAYFLQVLLAILLGSLLQLAAPFLARSIVDTGINTQDLSYVTLILVAQAMLLTGRMMIEFIRGRLLLHISTRINISILSGFWIKLMRLPLSYFDTRQTGDTLQRIGDHKRIESFLTGTALSATFSVFNLFLFSSVLLNYNSRIFFIFITGSLLYFLWIRFFLQYRRKLDHQRFEMSSQENNITMQLIHGMQEIKLQNAEHLHRWKWEHAQSRLFRLSFRALSITQYQQTGAIFINEGKNILITFLVAQLVIRGELTLGTMLAIQYIIGQLNSPVEQLISFMQTAQDAKISLERLNEIHRLEEEEQEGKPVITTLPADKSIHIKDLRFSYPGHKDDPVLRHINLSFAEGKTTAIVGASGSGKTTLLKLLLRFYHDYAGEIRLGGMELRSLGPRYWRQQCGAVMQDGFIFSDSIAGNIAPGEEMPDYGRLLYACRMANILSFVEGLPLGFNTKIGGEGTGISAGQRQRLLIARVVYKDPHYIFLDEATNSLDANNEKEILENLQDFLQHKTVVVVAHRLSTVRQADQIIVLHEGTNVESGTHEELTGLRSHYYQLVKNQLELGE